MELIFCLAEIGAGLGTGRILVLVLYCAEVTDSTEAGAIMVLLCSVGVSGLGTPGSVMHG